MVKTIKGKKKEKIKNKIKSGTLRDCFVMRHLKFCYFLILMNLDIENDFSFKFNRSVTDERYQNKLIAVH